MSKILNIETATRICSVALALDGEVVAIEESYTRNSHTENITLFAEKVVERAGLTFKELDAVAVSMGPGSYTGLRIGVSTAKGYCYALDIPLIAVGTLQALAAGMVATLEDTTGLFVPMIDARRMEVYAAAVDDKLIEVKPTEAVIVYESSFEELLADHQVYFAGDGSEKCEAVLGKNPKAHFLDNLLPSASFMSALSHQQFLKEEFVDVAYFEFFYFKDFVAGIFKVKGLK